MDRYVTAGFAGSAGAFICQVVFCSALATTLQKIIKNSSFVKDRRTNEQTCKVKIDRFSLSLSLSLPQKPESIKIPQVVKEK